MIGCRLYTEETHKRRWPHVPLTITRCGADEHICACGGLLKECDKEPHVCPRGVWQGPEVLCRVVMEVRDCKCDIDFCDLSKEEQKSIDYSGKKELTTCVR